jgi:uncharacterized protein (TIGR02271 family)
MPAMVPKDEKTIIPVAREELVVGKRTIERGRVRVTKRVQQREETVEQQLSHDEVEVERVAVNQVVESPPQSRYEGDVLVIPVVEEVLVVRKQLLLKEELRVMKRAVPSTHKERVVLRAEQVEVERLGAEREKTSQTTKTVVGLMDNAAQAEAALADLAQQCGCERADMELVVELGGLERAGLPEDDSVFYAEGLRRGGALVMLHARTDEVAACAAGVLRRHSDPEAGRGERRRTSLPYDGPDRRAAA